MQRNLGNLDFIKMHTPVLLNEVLEILNPQPGEVYIDATVNGGGHARAILEKVRPTGKVIGIDWDCGLIAKLKARIAEENLILVCDNYVNLRKVLKANNLEKVDGIIFDLGFSLYHVTDAKRGFSFRGEEPLDMRYSPEGSATSASEILNKWSCDRIEEILRIYGEEKFSKSIARKICKKREQKKISTTKELVDIIKEAVPARYLKNKIHFATRTFQALRIVVNRELENLEKALPQAVASLRKKGRIVVISFHSLEDRIVKNFLRYGAKTGKLKILTKKPIRASRKELETNRRARSAVLRAAEAVFTG